MINFKCLFLGHIWMKVPYSQRTRDGKTWCQCMRCKKVVLR